MTGEFYFKTFALKWLEISELSVGTCNPTGGTGPVFFGLLTILLYNFCSFQIGKRKELFVFSY
jgi:hypothetical protein